VIGATAALATVAAAAVATASSGDRVQRFPAPGSCHARGSGLFVLPDPRCTPGVYSPAVAQGTIDRTICVTGYTKTVRPPESVTEPEKRAAIAAYGDYRGSRLSGYELDHLVPLSLGGAPNSAANLWPEPDYPGGHAHSFQLNPKDRVEVRLRALVCERRVSLSAARRALATDWIRAYDSYGR
jgi:hypothetical protein